MAQKLGYFEEAGLDVEIQTPSDPAAPLKLVAAGSTDLAISYEPEVVLAREQGLDVKAVAALVNRPLTSMIWLKKSGINGVGGPAWQDRRHRRHPLPGCLPEDDPRSRQAQPSDVKAVNVGFGLLPALLGGRAQAMLGGFSNVEGVDLRLRGKDPVVTPVDKLGVPSYDELVLVASAKRLEEEPRSDQALHRRPGARHRGRGGESGSDRKSTGGSKSRPRPEADPGRAGGDPALARPPGGKRPYGYMDPALWGRSAAGCATTN